MPHRVYSEILNDLKLFAGVAEDERDKMLALGQLCNLNENEVLFRHGDLIEHFYIVCSGAVRLVRDTPDGKQLTTDISFRGKTIGSPDIFKTHHKRHHVTAIAVEPTIILEFPASALLEIAKHPVFALNLLSALSEYVHVVELEAEQRSTMTAAQRLACFLQRLCVVHGFDADKFELPYSKALIASRLGMKPETFSRTLATLNEHGISVENTFVTFKNVTAIEQFVCEHCSMMGECTTHETISGIRQHAKSI